ncbi:vWA domain-containing protein [Planococcus sp. APC 4015]|nr:vWA domain-containing protein [Planococcus sp. APC 4015]
MARKYGLVAAVAAVLLALAPVAAVQPATAATSGDSRLSETGSGAIDDLRTCVASTGVVNVYYLIDESRSLAAADGQGDGTGSDPDNIRADVLANSLTQLNSLGEGIAVNWAAGFFSTDFTSVIPWRAASENSADELKSAIEARTPAGYTNWPAALRGAQREIAAQEAAVPGCALLIWMTDGQLDIGPPNGQQQGDLDALNQMCGAQIDPRGAAPADYGIFDSLRQSGVVVVGSLLATTDSAREAGQVMRPLIEADGKCGLQPQPENYVRGAFVEADSPDALSRVFLELGARVGGGYAGQIDADGSFWVDPGVARFRILADGDWTLNPPAGSSLATVTASTEQEWARVTGGVPSVIDVRIDGSDMHGQWRFAPMGSPSLFLFSDLSIEFEPQNEIAITEDGEASAELVAQVVDLDGESASLEAFTEGSFTASLVAPDGTSTQLSGAEVDPATGRITIPVPPEVTDAQVVVEASISPLTTTGHQLQLAPVTTRQTVKTVLPTGYPRIGTPVNLSTLEGADGVARGSIVVTGPGSGEPGAVCVTSDPVVDSDSAVREQWVWQIGDPAASENCVAVASGETVEIPVSVTNETPADSAVRASVTMTVQSADGEALTQEVPIFFASTHPVNTLAVALIALILMLLGILLPLVLLWLINWATTRIDVDGSTQRAAFPVRITSSGVEFTDAPSSDTQLSERFRYRRAEKNVRSLNDADLGRLNAVVPWHPLRAPKYAVSPRPGRAIVVAQTGGRSAAGARQTDGSIRFAQLPLDTFWAIVVSRDELARTKRGDDVAATAVIYHGIAPGAPTYRERLARISRESRLSGDLDTLRAKLVPERVVPKTSSSQAPPPPKNPPPPRTPAQDTSITKPPPPRTEGPPPRSGADKPGSTPPSRPDSGPPPRPGTR